MMRTGKKFVPLLLAVLVSLSAVAQEKKLPPKYDKWLNEEVVYIITEQEREFFLRLTTDEQRDKYIETFWRVRDPSPGSPRNEYKEEHYRRLEYANKFLGRETYRRGWQTDRGRIYILLGEPQNKSTFASSTTAYPMELWFYSQDPSTTGLNPFFYILFFKRGGIGEYKLYSPIGDGPESLVTGEITTMGDRERMLEKLEGINIELAMAAMSLIPGDPTQLDMFRSSLTSDMLLAKIDALPQRLVDTAYLDRMIAGIAEVEVEYSYKILDIGSLFVPFRNSAGDFFLNYALQIEPEYFKIGKYEDKYYATLEVVGSITDQQGRKMADLQDFVNVEFEEEKIKRIGGAPFLYAGRALLLPGRYTINLMVRNKVSLEYGAVQKEVFIPEAHIDYLRISPLLLTYNVQQLSDVRPDREIAFQFSELRLFPNLNLTYAKTNILGVYLQIQYPPTYAAADQAELSVRFDITSGEQKVKVLTDSLRDYATAGAETVALLKKVPLIDFPPGNYEITATVLKGEQEMIVSEPAAFTVAPKPTVQAPWFYTRDYPTVDTYIYHSMKGMLYAATGKLDEAVAELRKAVAQNPDYIVGRLQLADILLNKSDFQEVVRILEPVVISDPDNYDALLRMGISSSGMKEYRDAIRYYERARMLKPPTPELLNSLGAAYYDSGNLEKAKEVFAESLKLKPDQPYIKQLLEKLSS
ncbi:MAG: GWxTD domain-containing protein [Candidatus Aminicenantes bacterium]|nr:GWxTD domain-containing protein [Candidatus Aminicenantes bacterium]